MPQKHSSPKTVRRRASGTRTAEPPTTPAPAPPAESERNRIEWLLTFIRTPLPSLRDGQLLDLRQDAWRFLQFYCVESKPEQKQDSLPAGLMERAVLLRVQGALANGIRNWEKNLPWNVLDQRPVVFDDVEGHPTPWVSEEPFAIVLTRRPDGTGERRFSGAEPTVLINAAAELLYEWWPQLRRCRHCGIRFLPTHGRQRYHNHDCAAQARSTKSREKRPRDYHEEYRKRLEQKQGAGFKPPRRRGPRRPGKT